MNVRFLLSLNEFITSLAKEYKIDLEGKEFLKNVSPEYQEKYKEQIEWVDQEQANLIILAVSSNQETLTSELQKAKEKKDEKQSLLGSDWYEKFKNERLDPAIHKFKNLKEVYDPNVRRMFFIHAQAILIHYGKEKSGSLANYIEAIRIVNEEFDRQHPTTFGYLNLASTFPSIIKILFDMDVEIKGSIGEAIKKAKEKNLERKGRIPLIQVKCDAERDFLLLVIFYVKALVSAENRPIFDTKAFKLVIRSIKVIDNQLITFLESLIRNYDKEITEKPPAEVKTPVLEDVKSSPNSAVTQSISEPEVQPNKFEIKLAPPKFLGKSKPLTTKNIYYDQYAFFSENVKTFSRKPKVQRALFCACAALLNGIKGERKIECEAYINQFTDSNDSTHKALAINLIALLHSNPNKVEFPLQLIAETQSVKAAWKKAIKHTNFAEIVNNEKKPGINSQYR